MNEFCVGPVYASPPIRRAWEPRLRAAAQTWSAIEWLTVAAGLRSSCLVTITPADLPGRTLQAHRAGLAITVLDTTLSSSEYAAGAPRQGAPALRCAIHRPGPEAAWFAAWAAGDDEQIGILLGFPACCRRFFAEAWTGQGGVDTTPFMATLEGPARASILLRWLGIRLVPWLPCSGNCEETAAFADRAVEVGEAAGLGEGVLAILEALALETRWTALHGIAEVVTPAFKFVASTAYTAEPVRRLRPGVKVATLAPHELAPWEDNGFSSQEAMAGAHAVVLEAVLASGFQGGRVLDLGCGDGALLDQVVRAVPGASGYGIDADEGRIRRGARRHPGVNLKVDRIEDFEEPAAGQEPWDLLLLMPGRLTEMGSRGADLAALLPRIARAVVVYGYSDNIADGGLRGLCERAGITLRQETSSVPGGAAGLA